MPHKLKNYLRTYRKRTGLTQAEVAFLIGCRCRSKISKHERLEREPNLRTLLAYEIIFDSRLRDLYAGVFEEVETEVGARKRELAIHWATPEKNEPGICSLRAKPPKRT